MSSASALRRLGPRSLTVRLAAVGVAFLCLALASIGLTLWVTWQLQGGAAAVNEAGRMRMQTWRLAATLRVNSPAETAELVRQFDAGLALLRKGDPERPLFLPRGAAVGAELDHVQQQWRALRSSWMAQPPPPAAQVNAEAQRFVTAVEGLVGHIEAQLSRWTSVLNAVQMGMIALAIFSAVALLYVGYLLVLDPLARLKAGLQRVARGDLAARIAVQTHDEFGEVSAGFNRMAERLRDLYQGLEDKVREKTASLEREHGRLAALYDVSAFVAHADSLDVLAQGFAERVRRVAHADAAAIRWSNEANDHYLLVGGDGLPPALAAEERCLATASCLCGQARSGAALRVSRIDAQDGALQRPCMRAGFTQVVTVPALLQQQVIGELDLFYRQPLELSDDDRALLNTLASHLASAMESLLARALQREAAVAQERSLLAGELHDSIAQSLAFLKIQVQLLREALRQGEAARVERAIAELEAGLRESTSDVRELLLHFRTRTNSEDIEPALRITLQKFEHQSGLASHLEITGHGLPLAADVQIQVLHVLQEALSNVRKHAGASAVWVEVQRSPRWRFEVRDDGCGFEPHADAARGELHVGLRIMRERAARIGAELEIDSVPGSGTCVALTLPAVPTQPEAVAQPATAAQPPAAPGRVAAPAQSLEVT